MMWKKLGKDGLAVKAPWPATSDEDKILTRQAKLLRDSVVKIFRPTLGKAKKGWSKATILVSDTYPQWKIDTLKWMQGVYSVDAGFPDTFMKDLKVWASSNVSDKKLMKLVMQFASFTKKEVDDVGAMAMDLQLPFDQKEIFEASLAYLRVHLNVPELDVIKLGVDEAAETVPDRVAENVTPGKPCLWCR